MAQRPKPWRAQREVHRRIAGTASNQLLHRREAVRMGRRSSLRYAPRRTDFGVTRRLLLPSNVFSSTSDVDEILVAPWRSTTGVPHVKETSVDGLRSRGAPATYRSTASLK